MNLSVVIPTYNTAAMTLRCCRAVLASMPAGTEVIVVDDGSSDDTSRLLADVNVIRLDTNRGFAAAANRGAAAARGSIILLLNSDALVQSDALQSLVDAFADPRVGIAGAQLLNEDGTPQWSGGATPTLPWIIGVASGLGPLARYFRRTRAPRTDVDWVSGAAMAVRREAWTPLNEAYAFYCQDIDLCVRARAAGWNVRIVPEARVVHALGGTIASNKLHHDPEKLWPDLLMWGTAHYGKGWSRVARVAMLCAAWFRIAWSALRRDGLTGVFLRAARRL